jgi:hypothetical protein
MNDLYNTEAENHAGTHKVTTCKMTASVEVSNVE